MKITIKYILCLYLFFLVNDFKAQQGPVTIGGEDFGSQGFVSFSIGQVDYLTYIGLEGTAFNEGLQHPYEYEISIIESYSTLSIKISPNVASDFVTLNIQNGNFEGLYYAFYDVQGKLIEKHKILESQTSISLEALANSIYFVKIFDNNDKKIKTFKIIKK